MTAKHAVPDKAHVRSRAAALPLARRRLTMET